MRLKPMKYSLRISISKADVHQELRVCQRQNASFSTNQTFPWFALLQKLNSEELGVAHLVKKFSKFHGIRKFIIVSTRAQPLAANPSHFHPINTLKDIFLYFFKTRYYITLPSKLRSPRWSLPFWFCDKLHMHFTYSLVPPTSIE